MAHIEHCAEHLPGHTVSIELRHPGWRENETVTLPRLHGRNAVAYGMPAKSAAERFDYAYTSAELRALAQRRSQMAWEFLAALNACWGLGK